MKSLQPLPSNTKREIISKKASQDFDIFFRKIFPLSFATFITGNYITEIARFLKENSKTIRIGPRDHIKSTSFYAYFMWKLLRAKYIHKDLECHYFSYKNSMAGYHVGSPKNEDNIKELIRRNPFFNGVLDLKENSEGTAIYTWNEKNNITLTAHGLLTFTRGTHTRGIIFVDDPLQDEDPHSKLDPTRVRTINNRIKSTIYSMPQYEMGAELHIVGTPQTEEDFFFDPKFTKKFAVKRQPAILDQKKKKVLFPEFRPWKWLMDKKDTLPESVWLQEYMVKPTYSADSFLKDEVVSKCIKDNLKNYAKGGEFSFGENDSIVGGWDIGKHQHPSHLSIYQLTAKNKFIQRVSFWMDNWDYTSQLDFIEKIAKRLSMSICYYDATRGEFESLHETGKMPEIFKPINLTPKKTRWNLARALAQKIEKNDILLLNDDRQFRQMLVVDSDLKARETKEGHGDSFWSNALAMESLNETGAAVEFI